MDAFVWIVIVALGACLLMHLMSHGHGHGRGAEHDARSGAHGRVSVERETSGKRVSHATDDGHRPGHRGCHGELRGRRAAIGDGGPVVDADRRDS